VAVDERAMAVVAVLAVRPGNVRVGFLAGDHAEATGLAAERGRGTVRHEQAQRRAESVASGAGRSHQESGRPAGGEWSGWLSRARSARPSRGH
jgi:hypothetical protein